VTAGNNAITGFGGAAAGPGAPLTFRRLRRPELRMDERVRCRAPARQGPARAGRGHRDRPGASAGGPVARWRHWRAGAPAGTGLARPTAGTAPDAAALAAARTGRPAPPFRPAPPVAVPTAVPQRPVATPGPGAAAGPG